MDETIINNCQGQYTNGKINMSLQLDGQRLQLYESCNNGMQFRINAINKIKDFVIAEICQKETMSKTISKYIAAFDLFDKTMFVCCCCFFI